MQLPAVSPKALANRIAALPASPGSERALERLLESAEGDEARITLGEALADPELAALLGNALGDCPYLLDLAAKDVGRLVAILKEPPEVRVENDLTRPITSGWLR